MKKADPPLTVTPDGRYLIVRGRLWRMSNPAMTAEERSHWVSELMTARRTVAAALRSNDTAGLRQARAAVQTAKVALGERGPVWWQDGTPDYNRRLVHKTPYADWFAALETKPNLTEHD